VSVQTLVLVLTDVQGSARLWQDEPAAMDAAMQRHHEIVHATVAEHGGFRPVDQGEGDAVFAAFPSASEAVAAVAQVQRALEAEPWPTSVPLRVRIGVHVGEVIERGGNLFGDAVNRCARLRGLASGGQALLSAAVYELVRDKLPSGLAVQNLGEHRMKDLVRPEHVWQLDVDGPGEFGPLQSLDRVLHNLPVQRSALIGRDVELARAVAAVREHRLVTLTGFGGMGKTRLALQAAAELVDDFPDGVWLVDLSVISNPDEVAAAIGRTTSQGGADADSLVAALAGLTTLLVLDNLEQVLGCAPLVAQLLDRLPGVRVLATSREALRVRAEQELVLPPLAVPPDDSPQDAGSLGAYAAVQLFVDRAVAARADFRVTNENAPSVAAICARLDGHPLAVELAAARLRMMTPQALLPRLDKALSVLTSGSRDMPDRHQTLRATIAWSYDALEPDMRLLLDRMSVFPAPATFEAVEAVCGKGLDVFSALAVLVDRSLVRFVPRDTGEDRYGLLAAIRDYALEQAADQLDALRERHFQYYTALVGWRPLATLADYKDVLSLAAQETAQLAADWQGALDAGDDVAVAGFPLSWCLSLQHAGELVRAAHVAAETVRRAQRTDVQLCMALETLCHLLHEYDLEPPQGSSTQDLLARFEEAARELGRADFLFHVEGFRADTDTDPEQILRRVARYDELVRDAPPDTPYSLEHLRLLRDNYQVISLQFLDRPAALAAAWRAAAADHDDLAGLGNLCTALTNDGRAEEGLRLVQAHLDAGVVRTDPMYTLLCVIFGARALLVLGRAAEALAALDRWAEEVDRRQWAGFARLFTVARVWALLDLDRVDEALALLAANAHLATPARPDHQLAKLRALRLAGRPRPPAEATTLAAGVAHARWLYVMPTYLALRVEQALCTAAPADRLALARAVETERDGLQLPLGYGPDLERLLAELATPST